MSFQRTLVHVKPSYHVEDNRRTTSIPATVELPLNGAFRIGRSVKSDLALSNPALSRNHVVITCTPDQAEITCQGANGLVVNGTRVKKARCVGVA